MRSANDHPIRVGTATGYLHRISAEAYNAMEENAVEVTKLTKEELTKMVRAYRDNTLPKDTSRHPSDIGVLAEELGVSADALRRLNVGHDGTAWTFPMRSGDGRIIGIHRRFPNGAKFCVAGSSLGLFVPDDLPADGHLLICEGVSDTAAALTLGYEAVGLPCAGEGFDHNADLIRWHRHERITIVADLDAGTISDSGELSWPGIESGIRLAERLVQMVPDLRFCLPPDGVKDLRQWSRSENADTIRAAVEGLPRVNWGWINEAWCKVAANRQEQRMPAWERRVSAMLSTIANPDTRTGLRFQFEERIAICTIDGGLPEDEAARIAFEQIKAIVEARKGMAA